jgi:hypothetical protein
MSIGYGLSSIKCGFLGVEAIDFFSELTNKFPRYLKPNMAIPKSGYKCKTEDI